MTTLHHTDPTSCRQTRARNLEPLSPQTEQGLGFPFPPVTLTHCLKHGPIYRSMVWSKPWQMNQTAWKPAHPTVKFQAEAGQDYDHSGIHRNKSLDLCGKGLQIPKNVRRLLPHIFPNVKKKKHKKVIVVPLHQSLAPTSSGDSSHKRQQTEAMKEWKLRILWGIPCDDCCTCIDCQYVWFPAITYRMI